MTTEQGQQDGVTPPDTDEKSGTQDQSVKDTDDSNEGLKSALVKEREARAAAVKAAKSDAKAKAEAEAQLKAIQDLLAGKDAEATEAQKAAAAAQLEATKYRIAYKHGLPPDLAERLRGSTVEELEADAEALTKYAKSTKKPKSDAGADDGGGSGGKKDPNALLRQWAGS